MRGIQQDPWGTAPGGDPVTLFTLRAGPLQAQVLSWGATLVSLRAPDRDGHPADVVLGFDNLQDYLHPHPYLGCCVGRVANRIAGAHFTLDGRGHPLSANDGRHTLHGGAVGLGARAWTGRLVDGAADPTVELSCVSPDGDQGFPGELRVTLGVALSARGLTLEYRARTDRPTPVNLSHHAYFNLAGAGAPSVLDHRLQVDAESFTAVDAELIPTGELRPVAGTRLDFREPTPLEARTGTDHNLVLRPAAPGALRRAAVLAHPASGRRLECWTTEPGLQVYTGNFLDGSLRGRGGAYGRYGALCLEAQHFPDAVHHPAFPDTVLRPGQEYRHTTVYRLGVA